MVGGGIGLLYSIHASMKKLSGSSAVWIVALLLTWAAIGYDYYDRHQFENGAAFEKGKVNPVADLAPFTDEQKRLIHHLKAIEADWATITSGSKPEM